jgi:hypothetical protein
MPFMEYHPFQPERPALRVTSTIIAVFLALSLAIFPIPGAMPAAVMGAHHGAAPQHATGQSRVSDHDAGHRTAANEDCSGHKAPAGKQAGCCDMGACHAFTAAPLTTFADVAPLVASVIAQGDEQVRGELSVRIERPPRTT